MELTLEQVPERVGHGYKPLEVLPLTFIDGEYARSHRRLMVFHHKGLKCFTDGCSAEGVYVIRAVDNGKSEHIDLYTADFKLMTVDHIHPKSKGGGEELSNKQPMCEKCNTKKADKVTEPV